MNLNKLHTLLEARIKGKSLFEQGHKYSVVPIYRGLVESAGPIFRSMDFVTDSLRFAYGHAQHLFVTEEEPTIVIKALVSTKDVYDAPNIGEYFYDGPEISGKIVKRVDSFE